MKLIALFLVTGLCAFVLDMLWLGLLAKNLYAENIGLLLRKSGAEMTPIWWSAAIVYICISLAILYFVLPSAQGNYLQALMGGVMLGLVTYGIYDFTNYSILAHWTLKITLIDVIWGMVLCGVTSLLSFFIQNRFFS
ncbi:DUF2177 family protein [Legionella maceachernii]|uniref:Membrane protein n=1 Tax=Legionella maceachernii TaxID=466 RepID=A0A0W0W420_9GAMM|nr:DUF2177 family protein [Legionella maceachernii]KTD27200.1 membrane protein [Legionella maceachernii]SKA13107.1 Uncharacterized membrane protein [Legionella maceachernii]SUP04737.1 Predicted membrane protein [Legionella maceachernii]